MKKELKIIIGLLLAVIVGITAAFVIYKNSLHPPQKPTPTVSLPEK